MSKPVHGRGTAAEQGAAIRQQMEEKEQKRLSSLQQQQSGPYKPPPANNSPRAVPPTHASEEAATPPATRKVSKRSSASSRRRSQHGAERQAGSHGRKSAVVSPQDDARAKRGSRALRKKAEEEQSSPRKTGGTTLVAAGSGRRRRKAEEGGTDDKAAAAAPAPDESPSTLDDAADSNAAEENSGLADDAEPSGNRSEQTAAATAATSGSRRHNYARKQADKGPVYATADGEEHIATSDSDLGSDNEQGRKAAAAGVAGAGAAAVTAGAASRHQTVKLESKGRVYPLTGIDNVALLMEDAGYQTACFSVYLFKSVLDYETVLDFFERLTDAYPKYRYVCELDPAAASKKDKAARKGKPYEPSGPEKGRITRYSKSLKSGGPFRPAKWRVDETFDLQENIVVREAKGKGDDESLFEICGDVLSEHFDFNKPLWQATLVHGLDTSEGAKSALMIKIHHAFSDGQGMIQSYHSAIEAMQTGMSIADKQAEFDSKAVQASKKKKAAKEKENEKSTSDPEQKKIGSRNIKPTMGGTISHSWHTIRGLYFRRREEFNYSDAEAKRSVKEMGGELSKNCRPSNRLYAHSDGIAMDDIKLVRQAFSTDKVNLTLNDVASAILSRALRIAAEEMAKKEGRKVRDQRVAVFIPISKRPKGDWTLANYTTGAIAWFRFHNPSHYGFEQLLHQVHREMNRIKRSYLPQWWFSWFNAVCKRRAFQLPNYPLFRQIFQSAYREYHVFTNLPGPAKPVKFGDHEAFSYHVLPPSSPGRSTMAIGTISYAHDFSLAVSCDATNAFKDKELTRIICNAFQEASQELVAAAKERLNFN